MQETKTYCDRCKQLIRDWTTLKGDGIRDNWQLCFPCYNTFKDWLGIKPTKPSMRGPLD